MLKRMAPSVDVTAIVPREPVCPAVSLPSAMLPPALTVMLPPPVVRLPSAATSVVVVPASTVMVPVPVVAIVSPRLKKYNRPVRGIEDQGPAVREDGLPALPFCPRSSIVMAPATIVTVVVPLVVATVSVPKNNGTVPLPLVSAANVVRSANVIRAGMPAVPGGATETSGVLLMITSNRRYCGELLLTAVVPLMSYVPV